MPLAERFRWTAFSFLLRSEGGAQNFDSKCRDLYRQRPASTQLTGKTNFTPAATRTVTLMTRFCLAPMRISPSGISNGRLHLFLTARLGTLPDSLTSSTTASPSSIAVLSSV